MKTTEKRIIISSDCFLLYAELLNECVTRNNQEKREKKDKQIEPLHELLDKLADKVRKKDKVRDKDYLIDLASKVRKDRVSGNSVYHTITTIIRKDSSSDCGFNEESSSKIFRHIVERYPKETEMGMRIFFHEKMDQYFPQPQDNKLTSAPNKNHTTETFKDKKKAAHGFANTTWFLYYHEYSKNFTTRCSVITRLVLHIESLEKIKLYESREHSDFVSNTSHAVDFVKSDTNCIILNICLDKESTSFTKGLQLRIIQSESIADNSIFFGQYMDTELGDKIVSGTFILENVKGHILNENMEIPGYVQSPHEVIRQVKLPSKEMLKVVQTDLVFNSGWERYIPKEIADYLSHKWKNHTKTKSDQSTLKELGTWLKGQRARDNEEYKFNVCIEYDLFIVTPVGNLNALFQSKYYEDINKFFFKKSNPSLSEIEEKGTVNPLFDSCDVLKEIGINRIYYTPRVLKLKKPSHRIKLETRTVIQNDLDAMRKSRNVILIMPELVQTSAFVKIGWAMQQEKPVIIFPLKQKILPTLLSKSYEKSIWVSDRIDIGKIPEKMVGDYSEILK